MHFLMTSTNINNHSLKFKSPQPCHPIRFIFVLEITIVFMTLASVVCKQEDEEILVVVAPMYGPSNQIYGLLSALALAAEYSGRGTKAIAAFFPIFPHFLQTRKNSKPNCLKAKEQSMIPSDYLNSQAHSYKQFIYDTKGGNRKFNPHDFSICTNFDMKKLDDNLYSQRVLLGLSRSFSSKINEYEDFVKVGNDVKMSLTDSENFACIQTAMSKNRNVIVISHKHNICNAEFYYFTNTKRAASNSINSYDRLYQDVRLSSPDCPKYSDILRYSSDLFTDEIHSSGLRFGKSFNNWLAKAVAIHIRVSDSVASSKIYRNTSIAKALGENHFTCKRKHFKTLGDFVDAVAKVLLDVEDSPRLFVLSNNIHISRIFSKARIDGRYNYIPSM